MTKCMKLSEKRIYQYAVAGVVFFAFLPSMFDLSILTGLGFIGSVLFSICNRTLIKDPRIMAYIVGGIILTYAASTLLPDIWENFKAKNWISLLILIFVYVVIYLKGYYLKKGKNTKF